MLTLIGQVVTSKGLAQKRDVAGTPDPFTLRAASFMRDQPKHLPVHLSHDTSWPIGTVEHLERSNANGLMLVARVDDGVAELLEQHPWHLSPQVRSLETSTMVYEFGRLSEVSLVARPASIGTRPVMFSRGDGAPHGLPLYWHDVWRRAHERMSSYAYSRADRLEIVDVDPLSDHDELRTSSASAATRLRSLLEPKVTTPTAVRPAVQAAVATRRTRAEVERARNDAAVYADDAGLSGYSYRNADGEKVYVRHYSGSRITVDDD